MAKGDGKGDGLVDRVNKLTYTIFNTDWGWMGIIASGLGLRRLILPQNSPHAVYHLISSYPEQVVPGKSHAGDLPQRLKRYLSGHKVTFTDKLDMTNTTRFQRAVWRVTLSISYGETQSYAWVARQMGVPRAMQAVGQALARNPLPIIIPCHRVIASDGSLCGFGAGLDMKRRLLQMEHPGAIQI